MQKSNDITLVGFTNYRNRRVKFGIKFDDRRRHVYIIGKTGSGKTTLLESLAVSDIQAGKGVAFIDAHGESAERLLEFVPKERINDVIYFNPRDLDWPIAFNVMEEVSPEYRYIVVSGLMQVFKKIWPDVWSPRMEYILNNTLLALLENPGSTLLGINRMLSDKIYRKEIVSRLTDPVVKAFWVREFEQYNERFRNEAVAPIQNKAGQFVSSTIIRNIIGQKHSALNMREIMDEGKILIVNLSKGALGEDNSALLGAMIITKLQLAAMSRVDVPEEQRKDFYLYVDEFQNFATDAFINILSEARKYRLDLILAHQYITQIDEKVRNAIFGNVGTIIVFRVGAEDAEVLVKEFAPEFEESDLINLAKYNIYIKLLIDGISSKAFSAQTLPPGEKPQLSFKNEIIELTRKKFASAKRQVEEAIQKETALEQPQERSQRFGPSQESKVYQARCWICGKVVNVRTPPGDKPFYCSDCLTKVGREGQVEKSTSNVSLKEAIEKGLTVDFEKRKKPPQESK